jgi:putative hydrolase of the HAD superfamily
METRRQHDIKAVAFDFGKVITREPDPAAVITIADMAGVDAAVFVQTLYGIRDDYDRGVWTGKEYYREVLNRLGVRGVDDAALEKMAGIDTDSWKTLDPETVRLIRDIKSAGYLTGILSNMPHDFLTFARAHIPLFSEVDAGIFSCEWSYIKPEKEIYEALLRKLGTLPCETLFFDDIPANIAGARALGIQGALWKNAGAARRELERRGVRLTA